MHLPHYLALIVVVALLSSSFCSPLQSSDGVAEQGKGPL